MGGTDFRTYEAERIRLLILRALCDQQTGSYTLTILAKELEAQGYRKSREYLTNQLRWLESEALAVRLVHAGSEIIVSVSRAGRAHVEDREFLAGIDRPDEG